MANALPDLKLLRIFVSVVRHQGFANAQQELNLSTSAISTYMSQLEAALGLVLCHRGRGGFSLTSKGELFHQETLRLLGELEGFEQYAAALKGELRGTLNLGVIDSTVSDKALPFAEAIGAYSQEHPAVHLHLSVMSPYELQLGVQDNRLDLAIGAFSTRMSGLVYMPLYREQHWLYCSSRHPLFTERRIPEQVITQQRMVGRGYWSQAELARHGFKHSAATVESMEAQLILVLSGAYIGYLPEHYAQAWADKGDLRVLLPATFGYQAPFSMIVRRGRSREPLIQTFRDLLKAQLNQAVKKNVQNPMSALPAPANPLPVPADPEPRQPHPGVAVAASQRSEPCAEHRAVGGVGVEECRVDRRRGVRGFAGVVESAGLSGAVAVSRR